MINKIQKTIRNALLAGTLALGIHSLPLRAEEPKVNFGYNALETAIVTERTSIGDRPVRNRLLTNISLDAGKFELDYQGLNEVNNWDLDTYFGRNRLLVGKKDLPVKLLVDTRANKEEIFDTKVGLRFSGLMEKLGGYGYADIGANDKATNFALFYGRPLGKGFSVEVLQDSTFLHEGKPIYYTELQLNKAITDRLAVFGRVEVPDFDKDKATYLLGLTLDLGGK